MNRLSITVAVPVLLAAAGCGTVPRRADAATAAATRMLTAVQRRDGTTACAALAPGTAAALTGPAGEGCAEVILQEDLPDPGPAVETEVYGQRALVRFTGDTVFLGVFPDGWRVVAAGCTARGDAPYDCVVQGG